MNEVAWDVYSKTLSSLYFYYYFSSDLLINEIIYDEYYFLMFINTSFLVYMRCKQDGVAPLLFGKGSRLK